MLICMASVRGGIGRWIVRVAGVWHGCAGICRRGVCGRKAWSSARPPPASSSHHDPVRACFGTLPIAFLLGGEASCGLPRAPCALGLVGPLPCALLVPCLAHIAVLAAVIEGAAEYVMLRHAVSRPVLHLHPAALPALRSAPVRVLRRSAAAAADHAATRGAGGLVRRHAGRRAQHHHHQRDP